MNYDTTKKATKPRRFRDKEIEENTKLKPWRLKQIWQAGATTKWKFGHARAIDTVCAMQLSMYARFKVAAWEAP